MVLLSDEFYLALVGLSGEACEIKAHLIRLLAKTWLTINWVTVMTLNDWTRD